MIGYLKNYATTLLKRVGYERPIAVRWADAQTASTTGLIITMPNVFCGVKLNTGNRKRPTKRAMKIARGLIVHEIGHSLQPLEEIITAERATNLNHFFVNILLDVHLERLAQVLYKSELNNLYAMRKLVRKTMMKTYIKDIQASPDFASQAGNLSLIGRWRQYNKPYRTTRRVGDMKILGKLQLLDLYTNITPSESARLADRVHVIADKFPELCQPDLDLPEFPGASDENFPGLMPLDQGAREELAHAGKVVMDLLETVFIDGKRNAPRQKAVVLASKLNMKIRRDNSSAKIIAPVTFDRRKMATGDVQPYYMTTNIGVAKSRSVAIALDVSGSMTNADIQEPAFIAAQAICLTVEAQRGSVCAGQFGAYGVLSANLGASLLFDEIRANRTATSFQLLSVIWLRRPESTVIVITDGGGTLPAVIRPQDKERTHVICLGGSIPPGVDELGTIHQCDDVNNLASIMLEIVN